MRIKLFAIQPLLMFSVSTAILFNYGLNSKKLAERSEDLNTSSIQIIRHSEEFKQCFSEIEDLTNSIYRMERIIPASTINEVYGQGRNCLDPSLSSLGKQQFASINLFEEIRDYSNLVSSLRLETDHWLKEVEKILGLAPATKILRLHAFQTKTASVYKTLERLTNTIDQIPESILKSNQSQYRSLYSTLLLSVVFFALFMIYVLRQTRLFTSDIDSIGNAIENLTSGNTRFTLTTRGKSNDIVRLVNGVSSFRNALDKVIKTDKANSKLARFDSLTGIYNRRSFIEKTQQVLTNFPDSRFALLKIDLDKFKEANDTYGHKAGDAILVDTAMTMKKVVRNLGICARIGGDEFVILLKRDQYDKAWIDVTTRLLRKLCTSVNVEHSYIERGASIGVSTFPDDSDTLDNLLHYADLALYEAKARGRNRCVRIDKAMISAEDSRKRLAKDLSVAINTGEILAYLQPKLDIVENRVIGFEALVRWNHPQHGILTPARFLDIAESSNLLPKIGMIVLKNVIESIKLLQRHGFNSTISINVSARELQNPKFASIFIATMNEYDVDACSISVELLETVSLDGSVRQVGDNLRALNNHGIKIWIDDFGVGYSTVGVLQHDFIYGLKIDRRFTCTYTSCDDDKTLLRSIVNLARSMGKACILEGVETLEEVEFARATGCRSVQGYYYAKPMSLHEVLTWYTTHNAFDEQIFRKAS